MRKVYACRKINSVIYVTIFLGAKEKPPPVIRAGADSWRYFFEGPI